VRERSFDDGAEANEAGVHRSGGSRPRVARSDLLSEDAYAAFWTFPAFRQRVQT
jgi:hypothetical protein